MHARADRPAPSKAMRTHEPESRQTMRNRQVDDPPFSRQHGAPGNGRLGRPDPVGARAFRESRRKGLDWGLIAILLVLGAGAAGLYVYATGRNAPDLADGETRIIAGRGAAPIPGQEPAAGNGTATLAPAPAPMAVPGSAPVRSAAPMPTRSSPAAAPSGGSIMAPSDGMEAYEIGVAGSARAVPGGAGPVVEPEDFERRQARALGQLRVEPGQEPVGAGPDDDPQ